MSIISPNSNPLGGIILTTINSKINPKNYSIDMQN